MQQAIKDLIASPHGILVLLLIIGATVLAIVGRMTIDQWTGFAQTVFAAFAGAHAVITATNVHTQGKVAVAKALMPVGKEAPNA